MSAAICLPGTSQPIPGKQTQFYLTGGALALLATGLGLTFLAEVLGLIGGLSFSLPDICSTDPPADPGLTAAEFDCLFNPFNPLCDTGASLTKVQQLIVRLAWYQWCQCVGVATPAAPAPPAAPSPISIINPPSVIPSGGATNCWDVQLPLLSGGSNTTNFGTTGLPGVDVVNTHIGSSLVPPSQVVRFKQQPPPLQCTFTVTVNTEGAHPNSWVFGLNQWKSTTGALTSKSSSVLAPGLIETTGPFALDPLTDQFQFQWSPVAPPTQTNTLNVRFQLFCDSNAVGGVSTLQCCPPPQDLINAVGDIRQLVTLLQRYTLPFAYINGAAHSGLTGQGSFAVSRLLGMHIHLSTIPGYIGEAAGTPPFLFDAGWVSILDGNGAIVERKIQWQDKVWLPRLSADATVFGYSLKPGVVATITELEAEP